MLFSMIHMKVLPTFLLIGCLFLTGSLSAHPDHVQALRLLDSQADLTEIKPLFEKAAADGHAPAMAYLGWLYETGQGGEKSPDKALKWYAAAAENGALRYAVKLGWMYLQGDLLPRDRALAEQWLVYALNRDYLPANVALGSVYLADALGGDGPLALKAEALLTPAFASGDVYAAYFLARLYREGIGDITASPERSFGYTLFGAMHGQAQMQGWLAEAYAQGAGIAANQQTAAAWALLAAEGGDPQAEVLIKQLDPQFSDQQWLDAWVEANHYKQQIAIVVAECCG